MLCGEVILRAIDILRKQRKIGLEVFLLLLVLNLNLCFFDLVFLQLLMQHDLVAVALLH